MLHRARWEAEAFEQFCAEVRGRNPPQPPSVNCPTLFDAMWTECNSMTGRYNHDTYLGSVARLFSTYRMLDGVISYYTFGAQTALPVVSQLLPNTLSLFQERVDDLYSGF